MPVFFPPATSAIPAGVNRLEDDFNTNTSAVFNRWTLGQSGGSGTPQASASNAFGKILLSASGAAGFVTLSRGLPFILLPSGFWQFNCNVVLPALSSAADRFTVQVGLGDRTNSDQQNGVYFEYSDNLNGGRWSAVTANGGTRTKIDTLLAPAINSVFSFRASGADSTRAAFNVNGVTVGSSTTNLPAAEFGCIFTLRNSTATVAHTMLIDYFGLYYVVTR